MTAKQDNDTNRTGTQTNRGGPQGGDPGGGKKLPGTTATRSSCNACVRFQVTRGRRYHGVVGEHPAPPVGTGPSGRALWRRIVAEIPDELELDARDVEALTCAAKLADRCRELSRVIEQDGLILHEPKGTRLHPGATELRQSESALVKHLSTLDLDVGAVSQTSISRGARARAAKRWAVAGPSRRSEGAA
jgi:hypothetical protein